MKGKINIYKKGRDYVIYILRIIIRSNEQVCVCVSINTFVHFKIYTKSITNIKNIIYIRVHAYTFVVREIIYTK
jgi:hypothetical protein